MRGKRLSLFEIDAFRLPLRSPRLFYEFLEMLSKTGYNQDINKASLILLCTVETHDKPVWRSVMSDSISIPDGFKRCSKCKEVKPATLEFFRWRKNRNNWQSPCRECEKEDNSHWRETCREQKRENDRRYYHNNAKKLKAYHNDWVNANPEKMRASRKRWQQTHFDEDREQKKRWRKNNLDKLHEYKSQYWRNNPDKRRKYNQKRRSQKRSLPATFTERDWQRALEYFNGCCAYCGNPPSLFDINPMRGKKPILHQGLLCINRKKGRF